MQAVHDLHAGKRLVAALAASVLVHTWLAQGYGERERFRPVPAGLPLQATLATSAKNNMPIEAAAPRTPEGPISNAPAPLHTREQAAPVNPATPEHRGVESGRTVTSTTPVATLPQPQDPTYYSARSLDVFPALVTVWDLTSVRNAAQGAGGNARANVLIDEAGNVNEVEALDGAAHNGVEQALRTLLLAAKFTPAQKNGRVVKARVLVQLNY